MTVLAKYQRLETEGLWRPEPDAQRRDVIVSIGDATLTIASANGTALSHWSLPAIVRLNPDRTPALYAPGENTPETLELSDSEMIDGIEAVLKSIRRGPVRTGRLRLVGVSAVLIALASAAALWLPGAIIRYTASLVPEGARTETGLRLRTEIRRVTGAPCAEPGGLRALEKLQTRLFPDGRTTLVVLPSALSETAHLPGGTVLIGHRLVEDHETPEVLAGYLMAEDLRRAERDPLERLLTDAGLTVAFRLLTTGQIGDESLRLHAERLVGAEPYPVSAARLAEHLTANGIDGEAYAFARDISGKSTHALIVASGRITDRGPLLADGDWLALQRICEG